MSVIVIGKFQCDTAKFRQSLTGRAGGFANTGRAAQAAGGIHHGFEIGDGFVLVVDEWETVAHFQQFFGAPELQAFIGSVGGAPVPPEVIMAEAVALPDAY